MNPTTLQFFSVPPGLEDYVQGIWLLENRSPEKFHTFLHPDGGSAVSMRTGEPRARIDVPRSAAACYRAFGAVQEVGVRLRPGYARMLPALEARFERLGHMNLASTVPAAKLEVRRFIEALGSELEASFSRVKVSRVVDEATSLMQADPDASTVNALATHLGTTVRTLERHAARDARLTARELLAIHRFRRAIGLLRRRSLSLAEVAAEAGYSDQAHMTRDVRRRTGTTPSGLRRNLLTSQLQIVSAA